MTLRAVVLLLTGLVLGLLGWWFTSNFGFTTEREYVGYSGAARTNPFYAAGLLLERMGKQVSQRGTLSSLEGVPADAVVVLPPTRGDMNPALVRELLAWVEAGGRLILGVETPYAKDPLLKALGVRARWSEDDEEEGEQDGGDEEERIDPVTLPDGRTLQARLSDSIVLTRAAEGAEYQCPAPAPEDGEQIMQIERGHGRVIVITTLAPFRNQALDELDHAALLWAFTQDAGQQVVLIRRIEALSLFAWLTEHALAALAALAALGLLWLWHVVPRFGPLRPAEAANRRSLLEHLRAIGRFQADAQQLGRLVREVRADAQALFARLAPLAATLEGPARLREASRLTGLRPRELLQAFEGPVSTRNEFSNAVRTLAAFRRRLVRRTRRDSTP